MNTVYVLLVIYTHERSKIVYIIIQARYIYYAVSIFYLLCQRERTKFDRFVDLNVLGAGIDFSRQNLTSVDVRFWRLNVRFWRLKSIPEL